MTSAVVAGSCSSVKEDDWICGWASFVFFAASAVADSRETKLSREVSLEQLAPACCHNGSRGCGVTSSDDGGISTREMNCRFLLSPVVILTVILKY